MQKVQHEIMEQMAGAFVWRVLLHGDQPSPCNMKLGAAAFTQWANLGFSG